MQPHISSFDLQSSIECCLQLVRGCLERCMISLRCWHNPAKYVLARRMGK